MEIETKTTTKKKICWKTNLTPKGLLQQHNLNEMEVAKIFLQPQKKLWPTNSYSGTQEV